EHHRDLAALGFIRWARFGPRRKLGRCGRGSGKLGNRPKQSPAISKKHNATLSVEILAGGALRDRKTDPVPGKPVGILGESERSEPLSDRWHCATRPLARGSLRMPGTIRDWDLQARPRMLSCRIRAPRPPQMRLRSSAPIRCRCSRSSDRAAALRAAVGARAAAPRSGHPDERYELGAFHLITSSAQASTASADPPKGQLDSALFSSLVSGRVSRLTSAGPVARHQPAAPPDPPVFIRWYHGLIHRLSYSR